MGDKSLFSTSTIPRPKTTKTVARHETTHVGLKRVNPKPLTIPVSQCSSKFTKPHNCLPSPRPFAPHYRSRSKASLRLKSVSLVELPVNDFNKCNTLIPVKQVKSEVGYKTKVGRLRPSSARTLSSSRSFLSCSSGSAKDGTPRLATRVLERFVVNAWRKRRAEVDKLKVINQKLLREVEFLRVDVIVLKKTLKSKKLEENEALFNDSIELKVNADKERETNRELLERLKVLLTEKEIWLSKEKRLKDEIQFLLVKRREIESINFDLTQKCSIFEKSCSDNNTILQQLQNKLQDSEIDLKNKTCELEKMTKAVMCFENERKKIIDSNLLVRKEMESILKRNYDMAKKMVSMESNVDELTMVFAEINLQCDAFKSRLVEVQGQACFAVERLEEAEKTIQERDEEVERVQLIVDEYKTKEEATKQKVKWAILHVILYSTTLFPIASLIQF